MKRQTLAVVFDFDDTLVPDSTTLLLEAHGIDVRKFWASDTRDLIEAGYDQAPAYLKLLLDKVGANKPLGRLTNGDLGKFGATLDKAFFPGLPRLFDDLRKMVNGYNQIQVEFYIISGGLQEVMQGSSIVASYFSGVYGCRLAGDSVDGPLKYIQRCVTFTEKTRYLFEINKGLAPAETRRNPLLVNKDVPEASRRIPFKNIIYVGDGLTDIPCFSLVRNGGGFAFGVFDPRKQTSAKRALVEFLKPDRVISMHAPRYRKTDELGSLLRAAVANRATQITVERQAAEYGPG